MGVLGATVRFTGPVPTNTSLCAALSQHIGKAVSYKEEKGELTCPALISKSSIFGLGDPQEKVWILRTGYLDGSYFWYATLVVMEKLGGIQQDFDGKDMPLIPAPAWAYKPWRLAKREYRWRKWRKPVWLTLNEARHLGVE